MSSFKNMGWFCLVIGFSNIWGMDLAQTAKKNLLKADRLKGLHLVSLNKVTDWGKKLSVDQKEEIHQYLNINKKPSTLFLFNVATLLLPELKQLIVSSFLNNNLIQAQSFLDMPIANALNRYQDSCRIMDGRLLLGFLEQVAPGKLALLKDVGVDKAFKLLNGMKLFEEHLRGDRVFNRSELQEILAVCNEFNRINKEHSFSYQYRDACTVSNFVESISTRQLQGLIAFIIPFISVGIDRNFCKNVLDQKIVDQNRLHEICNEALRREYQNTGDLLFNTQFPIRNPYHGYSDLNFAKTIAPYLLTGPSMLVIDYLSRHAFQSCIKDLKDHIILFGAATVIIGCMNLAMSIIIWYGLPYLFPMLENDLIINGISLAAYVSLCCIYNIKNMRSVRTGRVQLPYLSTRLNDSSIDIE